MEKRVRMELISSFAHIFALLFSVLRFSRTRFPVPPLGARKFIRNTRLHLDRPYPCPMAPLAGFTIKVFCLRFRRNSLT